MPVRPRLSACFFVPVLFVVLGLLPSSPLRAGGEDLAEAPPPLDSTRLAWSSLALKGRKLLVSMGVDVRIRPLTERALAQALVVPPRGRAVAAGGSALLMEYRLKSLRKDLRVRLWLRGGDGAALQRSRLELTPGEERYKLYRFTEEGIYILRRTPRRGEGNRPPQSWGNVAEEFFPYPPGIPGGRVVSDPAALLYFASVDGLSGPGDAMEVLAYFDDELHIVSMRYDGDDGIDADFEARGRNGSRHVRERRGVRRLVVDSRPLLHDDGDARLQVIGLGGRPRIFMDRALGIPLALKGRIRVAGEVTLRLDHLRLADGQ
ncbi:MAG TPA: hypothetical protein ENK48_06270 [Gammaproteobacteria bacterium]|nr:hypothetical protein [Gammaproteobacteria bacterium]